MKFIFPPFFLIVVLFSSCREGNTIEGDKFFENGQYQKAVEEYNKYLEINPSNIKSLYNRGRSYEELGDYKKAMADFNHVLKLDPKNVSGLLSVGKNYYRQGNYDQAIFYIDKALKINNNDYMGHFLKGQAKQKKGEAKDALEEYNTVVSLNPDFGDAYLYRGAVRVYFHQRSAACSDFQMAMNLKVPDAKEAYEKNCK